MGRDFAPLHEFEIVERLAVIGSDFETVVQLLPGVAPISLGDRDFR